MSRERRRLLAEVFVITFFISFGVQTLVREVLSDYLHESERPAEAQGKDDE